MLSIMFNGEVTPVKVISVNKDKSNIFVEGIPHAITVDSCLIFESKTTELSEEECNVPNEQGNCRLDTDAKGIDVVFNRESEDGQKHSGKQMVRKRKRRSSGN